MVRARVRVPVGAWAWVWILLLFRARFPERNVFLVLCARAKHQRHIIESIFLMTPSPVAPQGGSFTHLLPSLFPLPTYPHTHIPIYPLTHSPFPFRFRFSVFQDSDSVSASATESKSESASDLDLGFFDSGSKHVPK